MEYLKCNNCGYLNVLKTEYQVFCTECNKKFENNYSNWKLSHPERTFEDFKEIECISDEDIQNAKLKKNKIHKKKGAKYWISLIATIIVVTIVVNVVDFSISDIFSDKLFDKSMMAAASQINESCPIMVDSETRLDNAVALPDKVFQYNYTLVNYLKEELDLEVLRTKVEPVIVNFVRTSPDLTIQRKLEATLKYVYKDKTGVYLLTIEVGPERYQD